MNELIKIERSEDGQLTVTSRQIAEDFEKEHNDTKKRIRDLIKDMGEISHTYFATTDYVDSMNRAQEEYLITRDGFTLLVMGFTGTKALDWKLKYIKAFNEMEQTLKGIQPTWSKEMKGIFELDQRTVQINKRMDTLENDMPLFNIECKELQALVRKVGISTLGGYKTPAYKDNSIRGKVYSDIQKQLKREFDVIRYEGIKHSQLDIATQIVNKYKVPLFLQDQISLLNNQIRIKE